MNEEEQGKALSRKQPQSQGDLKEDQPQQQQQVTGSVVRGPDGRIYFIPDHAMEQYLVSSEEGIAEIKAQIGEEPGIEVSELIPEKYASSEPPRATNLVFVGIMYR